MAWDFSTDPEFADKLDWAREFMRAQVFPLEALGPIEHGPLERVLTPLREAVKAEGLFAAHLPKDLGGNGWGQIRLAQLHEVVGASPTLGPLVFGSQAPDSGNAELIAVAGSDAQKAQWLRPLLDARVFSCFSMTEQGRGSDPTRLTTRAEPTADGWVLNGTKWFTSNAVIADLFIVMARTNDDPDVHRRFSMLLVPADTSGIGIREIESMQEVGHTGPHYGSEGEVTYTDVRVPAANLLGPEGDGFALAQRRLGPGRIHHVMRWVGLCVRAFDMLCERAVSVESGDGTLADRQFVQGWIADSFAEIHGLRLMTLHAAWLIDTQGVNAARREISAIKVVGAKVLNDVIDRALQVHGSLGYSGDMPLEFMYRHARSARIYDGPDEVHRVSLARNITRGYSPVEVPTEHIPTRQATARRLYGDAITAAGSASS